MTTSLETWTAAIRAGDVRAISRAVSAIENRTTEAEALLRWLFLSPAARGASASPALPGQAKARWSTGSRRIIAARTRSVGIIAVDPSSPFTGGAILGDRVRMQGHAGDDGIFIRSMATRGYLGGLAQSTGDAALLLDAAGKEMILVETVGVGQGEIEIVRLADCTVVVLVPGHGRRRAKPEGRADGDRGHFRDQQIGSRRRGTASRSSCGAMLQIVPERDGWQPPVVRTVATENQGVSELARADRSVSRACRQIARTARPGNWRTGRNGCCGWLKRGCVDRVLGDRASSAAFEKARRGSGRADKRSVRRVRRNSLKERACEARRTRIPIISAGHVLLDGGAMFGVIPRPMWEKKMPPDARNRITLSMNCLLIHAGGKRILVETGAGDKMNAKFREIYGLDGPFLDDGLRGYGLRPEDIDIVREHASALRSLRRKHARRKGQSRAQHSPMRATSCSAANTSTL